MYRRDFIKAVAGSAASWPLAARAQIARTPRVGVLLVDDPEPMGPFFQALRDLGYFEGKTIQLEVLSARGEITRLAGLAAEIVHKPVDVIVAVQTPAAQAAKSATRDIPIVVMAGDPVATGLVNNLARPDGNITGLSAAAAELSAKSLELVPEVVPGASRVCVLGNATDPFMRPFFQQIEKGAKALRLEVYQIVVHTGDDLDMVFGAIVGSGRMPLSFRGASQSGKWSICR